MSALQDSLHPPTSIKRLYLPRSVRGCGLLNLERIHDRSVLSVASVVVNRPADPFSCQVHCQEIRGIYRISTKKLNNFIVISSLFWMEVSAMH